MGEATEISWAHSTFNPWWGCSRVSPACDHCYAETFAHRLGMDLWGRDEPRRFFDDKHWREPLRWERMAADAGQPWRVFCASMADVFEDSGFTSTDSDEAGVPRCVDTARARLWSLVEATPHLTWMLLTKRPENVLRMVPRGWLATHTRTVVSDSEGVRTSPGSGRLWPANCWVGTSVENQRYADLRVPKLLQVPAPVRFLSCEPLLGPVDLSHWLMRCRFDYANEGAPAAHGRCEPGGSQRGIEWVIAGGESGGHARPMHPQWARDLRDQCAAAGVAFHLKQWGEWAPVVDLRRGDRWLCRDGHVLEDPVAFHADGCPVDPRPTFMPAPAQVPVQAVRRVGRKAAGRGLDGRAWDGFPS